MPVPSAIVLSGGLTKCPALAPCLAEILNSTINQYNNPESTALGAWMSAAIAFGICSDWTEAFRKARFGDHVISSSPADINSYKKGYSLYQEIYSRLYPQT